MNEGAWGASVAVFISGVFGVIMWKLARPHEKKVDESNSLASSITAIGDAAVKVVGASTDVSELMQSFIEPLRVEVARLTTQMQIMAIEHGEELANMRAEFIKSEEMCSYRVTVLAQHVSHLRSKMITAGMDPGPPPDLEGFTFD